MPCVQCAQGQVSGSLILLPAFIYRASVAPLLAGACGRCFLYPPLGFAAGAAPVAERSLAACRDAGKTPDAVGVAYKIGAGYVDVHGAELPNDVCDTYWIENITVGVAASLGDITVSNLNANSTYVVSGMFTVGSVATLIGSQAPVTLGYKDGAIKEVATFLTTPTGSVEFIDLYVGNFNLAGLLGGDTFSMTWIFETMNGGTTFDLSFNSSLISLGGHGAMRALAITEYGQVDNSSIVAQFFEEHAAMLPEPTTGTLSIISLCALSLCRRR